VQDHKMKKMKKLRKMFSQSRKIGTALWSHKGKILLTTGFFYGSRYCSFKYRIKVDSDNIYENEYSGRYYVKPESIKCVECIAAGVSRKKKYNENLVNNKEKIDMTKFIENPIIDDSEKRAKQLLALSDTPTPCQM
jgi:hypothetical protein